MYFMACLKSRLAQMWPLLNNNTGRSQRGLCDSIGLEKRVWFQKVDRVGREWHYPEGEDNMNHVILRHDKLRKNAVGGGDGKASIVVGNKVELAG